MRLALTTPLVAALAWGDFVYGSANHMAPTERIMRTSAPPGKVLAVLRDELERSSATEIATAESLAVSVSAEEDARWLERQRIAKEEWAAYGRRSRRGFNAISRPEGLGSAPPEDSETTAIQLSAACGSGKPPSNIGNICGQHADDAGTAAGDRSEHIAFAFSVGEGVVPPEHMGTRSLDGTATSWSRRSDSNGRPAHYENETTPRNDA